MSIEILAEQTACTLAERFLVLFMETKASFDTPLNVRVDETVSAPAYPSILLPYT